MERKVPLTEGETYHIFNRGAHKGEIFIDEFDNSRFQLLLYLANSTEPALMRNSRGRTSAIFEERQGAQLVEILAYTLLPNHFHLIVRQTMPGGITQFMRKLCTGYSMYFNLKHGHGGTLFQGKFKSSHIDSDSYFKWAFAYVHLNPISIVESEWKEKGISNPGKVIEFLRNYPYSSYWDYYAGERSERAILSYDEGVQYIDTGKDMQGLLASYRHGRVLYPMHVVGDKKMKAEG